MHRTVRRIPALVLLLGLSLVASQAMADIPVYTWVDAGGVRHYAQTPPVDVRYEVIEFRDHAGTDNAADRPGGAATGTAASAATAQAATSPADRQSCERARLTLEQLQSGVPLTIDADGDGEAEPLTDQQRAIQQRLAEQAIRAFCPA